MSDPRAASRLLSRRELLAAAGGAAALAVVTRPADGLQGGGWESGEVAHLLPAASDRQILLKASFGNALDTPPSLRVDDRRTPGRATDSSGRFFEFLASDLEPDREWQLQLETPGGGELCQAWPLRTLPARDAELEHVRLAVYTCAGGRDRFRSGGVPTFNAIAARRRLLQRVLELAPDVVVGVGDQIYWDQRSTLLRARGNSERQREIERAWDEVGRFDRSRPVLGTTNETVLRRIGDEQIASLYGTLLRSVPTFLTQDDHDYFENDEGRDELVTFPPDPFMLSLARTTQRLYYPEFLPESGLPRGLGLGSLALDPWLRSEAYGALRFGKLLEVLLYDCRRFVTLAGPSAVFVESEAERWLRERTLSGEVRHVVHVPSTPMGWSAGKWGEWYPDRLVDRRLTDDPPKDHWQSGWLEQHQRLLTMMSSRSIPLCVSGDLHALGAGTIRRSGDLTLERGVTSILSGPVSSSDAAWPSAFRGIGASVPTSLRVEEHLSPVERNGFTLLDIYRDRITIAQFAADLSAEPLDEDSLNEPFHRMSLTPERALA